MALVEVRGVYPKNISPRLDAGVAPIFQFDTSGKLLKNFGAGLLVSPHKVTWTRRATSGSDNGSHQVFKLSPSDGKLVMTLGKKGVAGAGLDEFDAPRCA